MVIDSNSSTLAQIGPERDEFRTAMARIATAVHIITTAGSGGHAGFTASAVCSVTDTPPTLLVCLNRSASVYDAFKENMVLCVNSLSRSHEPLANLFGGRTPMPERFAAASWSRLATGAPVLKGALAAFDCRVASKFDTGTHTVFFCQVDRILRDDNAKGLIYFERRYCAVGD
jgi:flavin reductase